MSTKIYNGYALPAMTLDELQAFTMRLRQQLAKAQDKDWHELLASLCCFALDKRSAGLPDPDLDGTNSIVYHVWMEAQKAQRKIKQTMRRDPLFDFECSATFFPVGDKILVTFYSERESFTKIWEAQPEVKEYGFWDNTDKPDNLTDEQWGLRGNEWNMALPGPGIPAQCGLTAELTNPLLGVPQTSEIVEIINRKSFNKRVDSIAYTMLANEFEVAFEAYRKAEKGFMKFDEWTKGAGKARYDEVTATIKDKLVPKVTKKMLLARKES